MKYQAMKTHMAEYKYCRMEVLFGASVPNIIYASEF